jgi:hypothetical protein
MMPGTPEELREVAPHGSFAPMRLENRLTEVDVFEMLANPGAGWGDPISRDPELVVRDLLDNRVDLQSMGEVYGVVTDARGALDVEATRARREAIRSDRRARSADPRKLFTGELLNREECVGLIEGVVGDLSGAVGCGTCAQLLSDGSGSYRFGCRELEMDLDEVGDLFRSPREEVGQALVLRMFLCPSCVSILDTQICLNDDLPYEDALFLSNRREAGTE